MFSSVYVSVLLGTVVSAHSAAVGTLGGVHDSFYPLPQRPLFIKTYPSIENYQSSLYEVYAEPYAYDLRPVTAVAVIQGEDGISGEIVFSQSHPPTSAVLVHGNITGLPPGKHGLHIHESGDLRQGCDKLGGHFNPYLFRHGGPTDSLRHVGDLGNIEVDEEGNTEIKLLNPLLSLSNGPRGVVGRAVVVTSDPDDLGKAGTAESVTTGSSGNPLACGIIAYIK